MKIMNLMPYIVSIITAVISGLCAYFKARQDFKNQVETIKMNNEHEIKKLMKQHEIDIDNLREQHNLEMKLKSKEHEHEKEIIELKSKNNITEQGQEAMNNALAGVMSGIMNDVISGKIKAEDLKKLSKDFKNGEKKNG